ncbi:hypothetical protein ONZ51_g13462 [Trametes cubensis]|uniref:Cytidyltransferase-like domain-containing protein n=1 Tax=Trametes cubensis TaxID=1111947 RepID=A0AAD7TEP5_9APHY|nr:hypothetical protein ONZ51_g13462 [Trametes cubensis]
MSSASPPPTRVFTDPPNYQFPTHRLARVLRNPEKQPLVLVACGSFSPVTYLHLRMFEMAKDYVRQNTDFEIVGGYLSPVSDQYKKPGLLSAHHRVVATTYELGHVRAADDLYLGLLVRRSTLLVCWGHMLDVAVYALAVA